MMMFIDSGALLLLLLMLMMIMIMTMMMEYSVENLFIDSGALLLTAPTCAFLLIHRFVPGGDFDF